MTKPDNDNNFTLNAVIGFLSLLLLVLIIALGTRIIFPRIENERAEQTTELIGNIIQIEVLNGCGVSGLANQFTSALRKNGFDVVETGNFENFDLEETIVIARTFDKENAQRVAEALGIADQNIIIEASDDFYLDATVVIGSDYQSLNLN
ncbi:LytR C-terminal domain-containing protein [Aliifodinibius sp. S!AR15-10]|uniref:LytR C-terminal domain-containing protein n=1 Tax=Aliifodinibius sp. S!AR15-10 TaxID=2950437 RepID=UPI00285AB147|nr:LytR C-terminal domain-containing protein [Aliifodinibius sp. S!AR15-10]MDR8394104.1 LytR C-terminal domain-containing protein [Aliifodinibius sp. S!AR15-10]